MKKFNPFTLLLIPIIFVVLYWIAYEKDNYPTRVSNQVENNQIVMK